MARGEWDEEALFQFYLGELNPQMHSMRGTVSHGVVRRGASPNATTGRGSIDASGPGSPARPSTTATGRASIGLAAASPRRRGSTSYRKGEHGLDFNEAK